MADGDGVTIINVNGERRAGASITDVRAVTFTADGSILVGLGTIKGRSTLEFFDYEGVSLQTLDIALAASTYTDTGARLGELDVATATVRSDHAGRRGRDDRRPARRRVRRDDRRCSPRSASRPTARRRSSVRSSFPVAILAQGTPQAVAR